MIYTYQSGKWNVFQSADISNFLASLKKMYCTVKEFWNRCASCHLLETVNAVEDRHLIELKSNAEERKQLGMNNMKSSYKIHAFLCLRRKETSALCELFFLWKLSEAGTGKSCGEEGGGVWEVGYLTWSAGCWWRTNVMMIKSKSNKK